MGFESSADASLAAHRGWAKTVDRRARLRNAADNSPTSLNFHLKRLGPEFDGATEEQRIAAAASARRVFVTEMARKSSASRRRRAS